MLKSTVKFSILTIWIIFISLSANIFYSLDALDKSDLVYKCLQYLNENHPNFNSNRYPYTFTSSNGGSHLVLLSTGYKKEPFESDLICSFDRSGNFLSLIGW